MKRLPALALVVGCAGAVVLGGALVASAEWTVPFQPVTLKGEVATMPRGATPTVAKVGRDAVLQWFAQEIVPGTPMQRYVVTRHSAVDADLVEELPPTTATTLTDRDVAGGKWYWTVRPVFALWRGEQSRKSDRLSFAAPVTFQINPDTADGTGTAASTLAESSPAPPTAAPPTAAPPTAAPSTPAPSTAAPDSTSDLTGSVTPSPSR
jgi:hypothetical protein